ncbi:MAG: hypothetical protein QG614_263 [Patescibacteria group bacterium]|nr:hypothetical protein [Patescibacteria group bacterium]
MKIGKVKFNIVSFFNYLIILSPLLISSFFVYGSKYPVWGNTLFLGLILSLIVSVLSLYTYKKEKKINFLSFILVILGIFSGILYIFISEQKFLFDLFGKGIYPWTTVSIFSIFIVAAYFYSLRGRLNTISIVISGVVLLYTILNFFLINFLPSVANYTGYLNVPMVAFGTLINYPFLFSLVVFIFSLFSLLFNKYLDRKSIILVDFDKKHFIYIYYIISILIFINIAVYTFRYVGASYYIRAAESVQLNDVQGAKDNINKAISIAPFDTYYLARIELINYDISVLLNSTSSDKQDLEQKYKELVEYQIEDAKKAVQYDDKNPANYMALGMAYERAMVLAKEDAYKLAADSYEKARNLADEKDFVDVTKAKLAFSADKEEDALSSLDRALKFNASSAPALYVSSQYYDYKNKVDTAVTYGEKAVQASPYTTDTRINLGLLYLKVGNYSNSAMNFISAYNLSNNTNNLSLYYAGLAYKYGNEKDNFEKVIVELEKNLGSSVKEVEDLKALPFGDPANIATSTTIKEVKK